MAQQQAQQQVMHAEGVCRDTGDIDIAVVQGVQLVVVSECCQTSGFWLLVCC